MLYYSEKLNDLFDSVEALEKAEKKFDLEEANKEALKNKVMNHIKKCMSEIKKAAECAEQYEALATRREAIQLVSDMTAMLIEAMHEFGLSKFDF